MATTKKLAVCMAIFAVGLYYTKRYFNGGVCESNARLNGKTIIITGANTGIGKETVIDFVQRGGLVVMACRSLQRANAAATDIKTLTGVDNDKLIVMKLDLSSFASIRDFVKEFKAKFNRLDVLVNNAGILSTTYEQTVDGYEMDLAVNHLGHFLLTSLLSDLLVKSAPSRVVTVSSMASEYGGMQWHDLNLEKDFSMNKAYMQSKTANVLFSRELGHRLKGAGVTTYSLHPGGIVTELGRDMPFNVPIVQQIFYIITWPFFKTPWHGAQTTICCAVDEKLAAETGKYYGDCAERPLSQFTENDDDAKRLWDLSLQMVQLRDSDVHYKLRSKKQI